MNDKAMYFQAIGEPYAAGLFEQPERSPFARYARAVRRYWEACAVALQPQSPLYPSGPKVNDAYTVLPDYSYTIYVNEPALAEKNEQALEWIREGTGRLRGLSGPHMVGGTGYTYSIPNYGRIAREGLDSYEHRVRKLPEGDFKDSLLDVIAGIRNYHARSLEALRKGGGSAALIRALEAVPFGPAGSLYEALVCWNFVYYLDFCDNPGRLDADLIEFYGGEDVTDILQAFFQNVDVNSGWSSALGPGYNALTLQCLRAVKGMRRPSLELRVTRDMPNDVWEAAAAAIVSGGGQPAFYNEHAYQEALRARFPDIPPEDLMQFNGGGCTETMLAGISNVGSLDAGVNLAYIFEHSMKNHLPGAAGFEDFYASFLADTRCAVHETLDSVSRYQQNRAQCRPQPMRTLLIDDCIDRGMDFNAGGARHS